MDEQRAAILRYLEAAKAATGLELSPLAVKAGVAPSTLTRFVTPKPGAKVNNPTLTTIGKISRFSGVPVPPEVTLAPERAPALKHSDKLDQLEHQQLSLLNRTWDRLFDDERAAIVATAKAFIANRRKSA